MKIRRRIGRTLMVIGLLMILSSAVLLLHNTEEERLAFESSASALAKLREAAPGKREAESGAVLPAPVDLENPEDSETSAKPEGSGSPNYTYIGYISIPDLGLELPVMDRWDYERLKSAPCLQYGDSLDKLVIAGHNYKRHFGTLKNLREGAAVRFTDTEGNVADYEVGTVEVINPDDLEKVFDSEWNLILYTCTYGGRQRVMVGCRRLL